MDSSMNVMGPGTAAKRRCQLEGCDSPITGRLGTKYCGQKHTHRAWYLANREKALMRSKAHAKANPGSWRERPHHIKKYNILQSSEVQPIYIDYKEPLEKVEGGFGYLGTLATNQERTHLQCHICGNYYKNLGGHLPTHKIKAREYKQKFKLAMGTALIGEVTRKINILNYQVNMSEKRKAHLRRLAQATHAGRGQKGMNAWSLERRNKAGNCPDQVIDKILTMTEQLGKVPSYNDFRARYGTGVLGSIRYHYGGWMKALKHAGLVPPSEARMYDRTTLLVMINDWRERHGREPLWSDFKRDRTLAHPHRYWKIFGGVQEARKLADALKIATHGTPHSPEAWNDAGPLNENSNLPPEL